MQKLLYLGAILISCNFMTAFAADQAAKEDTTPPPMEDALTVDQIPPIRSMETKNTQSPAATNPAPLPNTQPVTNNPPPLNSPPPQPTP